MPLDVADVSERRTAIRTVHAAVQNTHHVLLVDDDLPIVLKHRNYRIDVDEVLCCVRVPVLPFADVDGLKILRDHEHI